MTEGIIIAVLSMVGTLAGAYLANRKSSALIAYRLDKLEEKVDKHNSVIERTFKLEEQAALMAIFLCAFLANVVFSLWYNIKINREPFSREKLATGGLKALTFIVGLTLLCIAITTLPIFATEVGWTIPEEYAELFADLIIVGAVLLVACKYIKEAFTKFVAILNTPADIAPEKEGIDHEQQPVSNVFQDQSAPDQPQES